MERYVGSWLHHQDGPVRGFLRVVDDEVAEVCSGSPPSGAAPGRQLIMPAFVNAHTHIGDSIAYPAPKGTVQEIVGPDGYKHKSLKSHPREAKIAAMTESMKLMARTGTSRFVDFREEGLEGAKDLAEAVDQDCAAPVVLGRPLDASARPEDISMILKACDGIGMSAVRDWPLDFLRNLSRSALSAGKLFALHASEAVREEMDDIVRLRPSFVVHMSSALPEDIEVCAAEGIPIVVCPRSNEFFGLRPNIPSMLRKGVLVGLGTDNSMISRPDMLEEIKAAFATGKALGGITPLEAVNLAGYHGRKILSASGNITTEIGEKDDLVVLRSRGDDPLLDLVTRASSEDIEAVIRRGRVWWRSQTWKR
jgi:cytosine/adenosine deaminase-related metal-dependent hydrolase